MTESNNRKEFFPVSEICCEHSMPESNPVHVGRHVSDLQRIGNHTLEPCTRISERMSYGMRTDNHAKRKVKASTS